MQGVTMSTAFSGIGAPEVALSTVERGLAQNAGMQESGVRSLFAVEINKEGQLELQCLATKPECIFSDMVEFITDRIRDHLREHGHRLHFEDLVQLAKKRNFVTARATCIIHERTCTAERALLHVAGTPCVDYSNIGKRSGILGGGMLPFLAWVGQRRRLQEAAILRENVQQFAQELLEKFLGDLYVIQSSVFKSAVLGRACDRERRLTWMLHKRHVNVHPRKTWPLNLQFF
jgi:site-specific DNA-cytosine methylase